MAAFDAGTSAAKRRRERRLRSWWQHERMSIAAVLATVSHHSYPKVDTKNDAPRGHKTVTSTRVGAAEYYELSSDDGRPTGPSALLGPWLQLQRHAGIGYELVQALDASVLQLVEQLPDVHHFFTTCLPVVAEQVIDVPKIILENIPSRRLCRDTQLAGTAGGSADAYPTPFCSGLWSSTLTFQFLLVAEGETSIFKVFFPAQSSTVTLSSAERIS